MDSLYKKVLKKQISTRIHPNTIKQMEELKDHFKTHKSIILENAINELHRKTFK